MQKYLLVILFTCFLSNVQAQDPYFGNANQSLVFLDPSFAGSDGGLRFQGSYRDQWPEISSNYQTSSACADAYLKRIKAGVALIGMHDSQAKGTLKHTSMGFVYAQHFCSKDQKLKIVPSVQASYVLGYLDKTKIHFGEEIDPRRGFYWNTSEIVPSSRKNYFDLSSGLLINYNKFYFGFTAFHFNQPDEGFLGVSKLPCRLSFHSSYNLFIKEKNIIQFFAGYTKQANFQSVSFKVNALLSKHFIIGSGLSSNDQANFYLGYRGNRFVISAGYDRWFCFLSGLDAVELHLSFNFRGKEKVQELGNFETW